MKKSIMTILVVIAAITLTSKLSAQYSIPSFNVPVIGDPTTFEEVPESYALYGNTYLIRSNPLMQNPSSREEKKLNIRTNDLDNSTTAWSVIEIHSLDGSIIYGPYSVYEGEPFEMILNDELDWSVRILDASYECLMDVWFD